MTVDQSIGLVAIVLTVIGIVVGVFFSARKNKQTQRAGNHSNQFQAGNNIKVKRDAEQ
jgi:glucose uptake protein GlcU